MPVKPPAAPTARKALAALVVGIPAWGAAAQPDGISAGEWWGLAGVLSAAFLVWLVPNSDAAPPAPVLRPPTYWTPPDHPDEVT